MNIDYDKKHP